MKVVHQKDQDPMKKTTVVNIQIAPGDSRPIFRQIVDGIKMEIATGNLHPGDGLPSYRGLAMQLMINPNTVAKAYGELTALGLVESRKGLGLFVAEPRQVLSENEKEKRLDQAIDNFINETVTLDFTTEIIMSKMMDRLQNLTDSKKEKK